MVESHALVERGNFYPFRNRLGRGAFDLDDAVSERLELTHVQRELLIELLKWLEIKIWFWDKSDDEKKEKKDLRFGKRGLEVVVFWDCTDGDTHVCTANLFDMLREPFEGFGDGYSDIGLEEEIEVLEQLKAEADKAIALRREGIKVRDARAEAKAAEQ